PQRTLRRKRLTLELSEPFGEVGALLAAGGDGLVEQRRDELPVQRVVLGLLVALAFRLEAEVVVGSPGAVVVERQRLQLLRDLGDVERTALEMPLKRTAAVTEADGAGAVREDLQPALDVGADRDSAFDLGLRLGRLAAGTRREDGHRGDEKDHGTWH